MRAWLVSLVFALGGIPVALELWPIVVHQEGAELLVLRSSGAPSASVEDEADPLAGTPTENTKAFSVTNAGNTHIVFSSTTRMLFARCVNDTAVQVFIVNQGDASTAAGVGPYCSTCDLGPTLPVLGDAFLRAGAAGPADVRCGFVESWPGAMGMSGGGGMSMGAADTRYLKLAADNDPLTGALALAQGTVAAPGVAFASNTGTGLYFVNEAGEQAIGLAVHGVTAGLIGFAPAVSANGQGNTIIGSQAGAAIDLSGVGAALNNTFVGGESGNKLTTGQQCTYFGSRSGHENTTGAHQTCLGQGACFSGTSDDELAIGFHSGLNITSGTNDTFIGTFSAEHTTGATTSNGNNTFVGWGTGRVISGAGNDTFVGLQAGGAVTSAIDDTLLGYLAGSALTTGGEHVIIGREAGKALTTQAQDVVIGSNAGVALTDTQDVVMGFAACISCTTATNDVVIGWEAGFVGTALTTGDSDTLIGEGVDVGNANAQNRTVLGAGAQGTADNQVVLGNTSVTQVLTTGKFLGPVGAAGAPTYSFSTSPTDGMYFEGAHIIGITANGADALTISATQVTAAGGLLATSGNVSTNAGAFIATTAHNAGGILQGTVSATGLVDGDKVVDLQTGHVRADFIDTTAAVELGADVLRLGYANSPYVATVPRTLPTCTSSLRGAMFYKEDTDTAGTAPAFCLCSRDNAALTYSYKVLSGTGTCP